MDDIKYIITAQELLDQEGLKYKSNGSWWTLRKCPFCDGGRANQEWTFGVHKKDGNYNCFRSSCGAASSFWNLLKHFGKEPKEYIDKNNSTYSKKKKKTRKLPYRSRN